MLKEYLKKEHISLYKLAKESGIPYSTLTDIAHGHIPASKCSAGNIRRISEVLGLSMDEIYDLCEDFGIKEVSYSIDQKTIHGQVIQSGKQFYLHAVHHDKVFRRLLCKANAENRKYIDFIAETGLINILFEENR